ncbi:MAG: adenine phosphoribosyltransferase [Bacillota bacterium]|uniref:Adenine phosphoribosyltransferase n=1 Tax=Thermanaerosceptrum fracticalcis TaxID=1712410 RepID=A0A7G6DZP1_THEFR|nr:adenine phosphoribosyltransferase [Thermanaerosceptrum fracticalcis]QNB45295.1 adenine phosphoribosyltransferase [Thermanaerosceptrum fracticalcis]
MDIKEFIRNVPDFPRKGIQFKDITPLLANGQALRFVIKSLADEFRDKDIELVVGPEARGFLIGAPLAYELGAGFVPVRKEGKLPYHTLKGEYTLEYGEDKLEIHTDSIKKGQKVLIVDDLLATGGTIKTVVDLVEKLEGNIVGLAFLIELGFLEGRKVLARYDVRSLLEF